MDNLRSILTPSSNCFSCTPSSIFCSLLNSPTYPYPSWLNLFWEPATTTTTRRAVGHKGEREKVTIDGRFCEWRDDDCGSLLAVFCFPYLPSTSSSHWHQQSPSSSSSLLCQIQTTTCAWKLDYSVLCAWKLEMTFAAAPCHFLLLRACYWSSSSDVLIYSAAAAGRQDHTSPQVVDRHFHSSPHSLTHQS